MTEDLAAPVLEVARRSRLAAADLAVRTRADKDAALLAMADGLEQRTADIVAANADDVDGAERSGSPSAMIDRLRLDDARVRAMADGLRQIAGLPDPVGEIV